MKKSLKILVSILIIVSILIPTQVQADSFKLQATANKSNVKAGETVTITLKLADIDAGELGINTIESYLEYDKEIFEEVTQSSIQSLNNWSITYNDEETAYKGKMLAVILQAGVTENQDIGTVTLKVKNGVTYTNTEIKIKNITSNNGSELITETNKVIPLEIGTKPVEEPNSGNDGNTGINNNGGTTGNKNQGNSANISQTKIPNTGIMRYFVIAIAGMGIVAIVVYLKYKQYKKIDN